MFLFVYSFLEPTKLSLTCPASIYGIVKRMTETGEQVETVILIFEFLKNLILKQIVKQTFKT